MLSNPPPPKAIEISDVHADFMYAEMEGQPTQVLKTHYALLCAHLEEAREFLSAEDYSELIRCLQEVRRSLQLSLLQLPTELTPGSSEGQ